MASALFSRIGPLLLAGLLVVTTGCATRAHNPDDPFEGYNRAMFTFNENVDKALLKPVAQGYEKVTPQFVRTGVGNVFSNVEDVWIGLNNLLQGKVGDGMSDLMRFAMNSTFGLFGILDIASEAGLQKNDEDFGQTLAVWGVGEGPFVVLPLLGPRTTRDAVAMPADMYGTGLSYVDHVPTRNSLIALRLVHGRSILLRAERAVDDAAIDRYVFVRDAYLQQRRYKVHDGNPPMEYEDFDVSALSSKPLLYQTFPDALALAALSDVEMTVFAHPDALAGR